jgi:hypothetical protein
VRRFLIVSGVIFAALVVIYSAGLALFGYALTRADSYPTFMMNYLPKGSHSYQEAALTFFEFVVRTFPIGSDAKDAIAQIAKGGFEVTTSSSDSVELLWRRHAATVTSYIRLLSTRPPIERSPR